MLFPSVGGYMLKNTKDIIFSNFFFPIIPMGSGCFRLIYYLQKKEDFWENFSPIALKLRD